MKYWRKFWEINYIFCIKCYLNLLFWIFLYYFGHIEDVFLFLISFPGCLIWLLLISIENVCTLVLLLRPVWHDRIKKFLSYFMLVWNHFIWVFMNIFEFSLKTQNCNQLTHILYNKEQYMLYIRHICQKNPQLPSFIRNLKF